MLDRDSAIAEAVVQVASTFTYLDFSTKSTMKTLLIDKFPSNS